MRLKDKVSIITGGANGIGESAVRRFVKEGSKVVIADMDESRGLLLESELGSDNVLFVKTDTSDISSVNEMVNSCLSRFGHIDILINNAGITRDATLGKMSESNFDAVININLKGVYLCTQAVVPHLVSQGSGKIINTSSVVGVYGNFGQTNYAATKAGVIGMTKTWSKEFGRKGIQVNAVAPGFILTDMVRAMPESVLEKMSSNVALNRLGTPDEIANTYLFLASDESNYITGHVLHVDGGISM